MFEKAYSKLMIAEGGYANHPADRGGETFCGISRNHHPKWRGWEIIDPWLAAGNRSDVLTGNPLLMRWVKEFYRTEFWERLNCDQLPERIACELFDSAVNCGRKTAVRWLQHAVNLFAGRDILAEDGIAGEKTTIKTRVQVENFGDTHLLKALNGQQYAHYQYLVEKNPSQWVFFRGWLTRVWEGY